MDYIYPGETSNFLVPSLFMSWFNMLEKYNLHDLVIINGWQIPCKPGECLPFHFAAQETYTTDSLHFCE